MKTRLTFAILLCLALIGATSALIIGCHPSSPILHDINPGGAGPQILIAMRKAEPKDTIVKTAIVELKDTGASIKVLDITAAVKEPLDAYKVVVVVDAIWAWSLRSEGQSIINKMAARKGQLVVIATAGDPDYIYKAEGVDAVSAATGSPQTNLEQLGKDLAEKIKARLK
jgi:hypothetical protein